MTPTQLLHVAAGSPELSECGPIACPCWLCGGSSERGMLVDKWLRGTFTDHNRARAPSSPDICEACVWATAGRPPDTLRMYSHLYDDRGWRKLNKGDKAEMREWLRGEKQGPWFAAIADSGQKHCAPYAPLNHGSVGVVFFETGPVRIGSWALVDAMTSLLTAGATKAEIERGEYGVHAWQRCRAEIQAFEVTYQSQRGSGWFGLALWLAQRDEEAVQRRIAAEKEAKKNARPSKQKAARRPDGRGVARSKKRVPPDGASERAETLGHPPVADAQRIEDVREPRGVGNADRAQAPDPQAQRGQLTLFGGAGE